MTNVVPAPMRGFIKNFIESSDELMRSLQEGAITLAQWRERMEILIERYHTIAMTMGTGEALTALQIQSVQNQVELQTVFLDRFRDEMAERPDYFPVWRARMYTLAPLIPYQEGKIIKEIGRMLPLPAMPKQGTQCLTNCGCKWRIVAIDEEAGDYDAYWERSKIDSCQTCLIREELWYPVQIRGWELLE